jgi:hypothetical protein
MAERRSGTGRVHSVIAARPVNAAANVTALPPRTTHTTRSRTVVRTGMQDLAPDDSGGGQLCGVDEDHVEHDPVASLHDTEAEAGDEVGTRDLYCMDTLGAEQRGVALDLMGAQEALLD